MSYMALQQSWQHDSIILHYRHWAFLKGPNRLIQPSPGDICAQIRCAFNLLSHIYQAAGSAWLIVVNHSRQSKSAARGFISTPHVSQITSHTNYKIYQSGIQAYNSANPLNESH